MRNKAYTTFFCLYLFICAIGIILYRNKDFSEMENRQLAKFPKVDAESIISGEFGDNFDKYVTDHIAGKDFLVKLKVETDLLLNKSFINGVFFSDDEYLIQDYRNPYNQLIKNLEYVNEFADNNAEINVTWLIIPNACYIYEDKLPSYASCYDQREVLSYIYANVNKNINLTDCANELKLASNEYIFYKTDHHWTMNGAYIGYKVLCEKLGINANEKDIYEIEIANDSFLGSQYSNAPTFNQSTDDIIFYNNPNGEYKVDYYDTNETYDALYVRDNLNKKDKYTAYLGGNHPFIKITSNSANKEKLLVVKDSYAHTLLPLLADNYSEIYVVDLRYYHSSVSELAKEENISNILFINNLEFLSTDNNFLWLN